MKKDLSWVRYLSPFAGIIFCPVTILFLWAFFSVPIESELSNPNINISIKE